jgi:hypothetical protein
MSDIFEITPINVLDFAVKIKRNDEKWKNFPAHTFPKELTDRIVSLKDLKIFKDDVILCGFPRSGTTLMQEMIWHIVNAFDFEKGKSAILDRRFPLLEGFEFIQHFYDGKVSMTVDDLERPRTLKTHLPVNLLPDEIWERKPKIIHISRDAKDVAVSM